VFPNLKNQNKAFTIIELLTVMSIIILLIGLLAPALNQAKRFAKKVKQRNQLKAIGNAIEMFRNDFDEYPDSSGDAPGSTGTFAYCGATKLTEALIGQDLSGYHPDSRFREDYQDSLGNLLYDRDPTTFMGDPDAENLDSRSGPYLQLENANAHRLWHLYGPLIQPSGNNVPDGTNGTFNANAFVLCDVYSRVENKSLTGKSSIGMPILYYKADTSGNMHPHFRSGPGSVFTDSGFNNITKYIYDHRDNDLLVQLGKPWEGIPNPTNGAAHLMDSRGYSTRYNAPLNTSSAEFFYERTYNENIALSAGRPHRADSFILQSAGFDGDYGTNDDVFNFSK